MTAANTSITGYTVIPAGQRVDRPTRRRVRGDHWSRLVAHVQTRRAIKLAWQARRRAELAEAPRFDDPRTDFTRRHPDAEIHRL